MTDLEKDAWDAMVAVVELAAADTSFGSRYKTKIKTAVDAMNRSDGDLPCGRCAKYFPPDMLRVETVRLVTGEDDHICKPCFKHVVCASHDFDKWEDFPDTRNPSLIDEIKKEDALDDLYGFEALS